MDMTEFSTSAVKDEGLVKVTMGGVNYYLECSTKFETFYEEDIVKEKTLLTKSLINGKKCHKCGKRIMKKDRVMNLPVFDDILNIYKVERYKEQNKKLFVKLYAEEEKPIRQALNVEIKNQFNRNMKGILQKEFEEEDYACLDCKREEEVLISLK